MKNYSIIEGYFKFSKFDKHFHFLSEESEEITQ